MSKFRKKPVVIDAVQFVGGLPSVHDIETFMGCPVGTTVTDGSFLVIATLEGAHRASPGDWIIKGVKGEFYPCKPDIFEATYEAVNEQAA